MPWRESCAMEQRGYFMLVAATGEVSFAALCRQFGISRDTGYRWLRRWRAEGGAGLVERSRAARTNPRVVASEIEACLDQRRQHPTGDLVKVKAALERRHPGWLWPAASTIGSSSRGKA